MGRQVLQDGPYIDTMIASGSALVATTAQDLWAGSDFTPIFAREAKAGRIYIVEAGGIMSTAGSGTLIIGPGIGTTSPGTTLGVSVTQTVPINLTNVPWVLQMRLVVRVVGAKGANSTIIGTGWFQSAGTAATAGTGCILTFGGTSVSFDATVENWVTVQKTLSVAGSMTVQYAHGFWRN
jgi:hypothetical protein